MACERKIQYTLACRQQDPTFAVARAERSPKETQDPGDKSVTKSAHKIQASKLRFFFLLQ
jgi:hypothetical protein